MRSCFSTNLFRWFLAVELVDFTLKRSLHDADLLLIVESRLGGAFVMGAVRVLSLNVFRLTYFRLPL